MLRLFRKQKAILQKKKKAIHLDIAAEQFITHCDGEGTRLEAVLSSALKGYCDGEAERAPLPAILGRSLVSSREGRLRSNPRMLVGAHCYAIALSKGLHAVYDADCQLLQARGLDRKVARLITAQDVGPDQVGHAPNPYPETGIHISYPPDTLVGGVPSQMLALVQRYRRLRSREDALSMFCLASRIVPAGTGIGIGVFKEAPGSRHGDVAAFKLVGYRAPETVEIDEWSRDLEILDADQVLAPLPTEVRAAMLAAIDGVDPFWPSFSESHTLTWR